MANVPGEKNIGASVKKELADAFLDSIPDKFKKKHVFSALFQIWLSIPESERMTLLTAEQEGLSLESVILSIVDRVIARLHHERASGAAQAQKHTPKRKGAKGA